MIDKIFTTKTGYPAYVVYVNNSHYCGYVAIPKTHPAYRLDYYTYNVDIDDITQELVNQLPVIHKINKIEVHGGLTFADDHLGREKVFISEDKEKWVFGFDAAHSGDKTAYTNFEGDTFKDLDYMTEECEKLAQQLKDIEDGK